MALKIITELLMNKTRQIIYFVTTSKRNSKYIAKLQGSCETLTSLT